LPQLLRGRPSRHATAEGGYVSHNVQEVRLTLDSGFTLDGELFESDGRTRSVALREGGQASFVRC
jgi:diacylglycerol kinase (ATP)